MRRLILFLVAASLFSCDSVEQHRAAIETLATNWDNATNTVTALAGDIGTAKTDWVNQLASMAVSDEHKANMDEAVQTQLTELQATAETHTSAFDALTGEIGTFVEEWTTKGEAVTALKDGLASGSISPDLIAQIPALTEAVTAAGASVEGWTGKFTDVKTACAGIAQQMAALLNPAEGGATE